MDQHKVVVVTGGGGALGSVVAQTFLTKGHAVAVTVRSEEERTRLAPALKEKALVVRTDVTDEKDVRALYDTVMRKHSRVDIAVNTVGGFLSKKNLTDVAVDEWERMFSINLRSAFLCTREALRRMKGYGRIINISAMVGLKPTAGRAPYAISKAGVTLLTEIAAEETKGTGITVNAIAPSIIATEANKKSMPEEDFTQWVTPEQIAETMLYLCSDDAASISGTTIRAFGGV
ncbi:MAG: SDR family NAD(P)-dependent oxidoreductase [Bacteroidota bacterium]